MTARTPNVFIVGAGRVATALGGALRHAGVPVLGLFGRRAAAVRTAAGIAGVAGFSAAPPDLLLEADAVIVAVRDDAVAQVARTLVETGFLTPRHVLLHCSGGVAAADAFGEAAARVGGVGTLHPLRAIVDPRQAAHSLKGTTFGIEGNEAGRAMAQALVGWLGGVALDVEGEGMALYHAAASIASNYLVALFDAAGRALSAAGVPGDAGHALLPLVHSTLENIEKAGIPRALTGPIARGDVTTVERHLAALRSRAAELVPLYQILGQRAVALARDKGEARPEDLDAIAALVATGPVS
ncbi:MAG TPA: DUF2520 domain-containing protein [Haliangiales bacterium]|nr:DUF2520 domain-containing protein [Haliangiales bacterium]